MNVTNSLIFMLCTVLVVITFSICIMVCSVKTVLTVIPFTIWI